MYYFIGRERENERKIEKFTSSKKKMDT